MVQSGHCRNESQGPQNLLMPTDEDDEGVTVTPGIVLRRRQTSQRSGNGTRNRVNSCMISNLVYEPNQSRFTREKVVDIAGGA